jgi:hypothetical protein
MFLYFVKFEQNSIIVGASINQVLELLTRSSSTMQRLHEKYLPDDGDRRSKHVVEVTFIKKMTT